MYKLLVPVITEVTRHDTRMTSTYLLTMEKNYLTSERRQRLSEFTV